MVTEIVLKPIIHTGTTPIVSLEPNFTAVEGRVTDVNGNPLPYVPIVITDIATQQTQQITSDADGYFKASVPADSPYSISVENENYEPFLANVAIGQPLPDITLLPVEVAPLIATIDGRVVNEHNVPMKNIPVVITDSITGQRQEIMTDDNGYYQTMMPANSPYNISIEQPDYQAYTTAMGAGQTPNTNIALTPIETVAVVDTMPTTPAEETPPVEVADATDAPLAYTSGSVPEETPDTVDTIPATPAVETPPVEVADATDNTPPAYTSGSVPEETPDTVDTIPATPAIEIPEEVYYSSDTMMYAPPVATIGGHILSADNTPIANIPVLITDRATGETQQLTTDSNGYFSTSIPADNPYTVTINNENYEPFSAAIEAGKNLTADVILNPAKEAVPVENIAAADTVSAQASETVADSIAAGQQLAPSTVAPPPAKTTTPAKQGSRELLAVIYFDLDRANLSDQEIEKLKEIADTLLNNPKQIELISYTDEVGGPGYNNRLSKRRLNNISNRLVTEGIGPKTISTTNKRVPENLKSSQVIATRRDNNRIEIWSK